MKHLILTSALFLTATLGFAQNITEPDRADASKLFG